MRPPADGWDQDEQEALRDLAEEFEVLRRVAAEEAVLDRHGEARLLARVLKGATDLPRRESVWSWLAQPAFAMGAACLVLVAGLFAWRTLSSRTEESRQPPPVAVTAAPSPAPTFHLKLDAPAIRLSTAVLSWRGAAQGNRLLADLEPGLAAFKSGDYSGANTVFSRLAATYPNAFDVHYYQGITRLFVNDINGAMDSLTAAERLADSSFAPDVAWYLAVANERAGKADEVRSRLTRLCQAGATHAADACTALPQIR